MVYSKVFFSIFALVISVQSFGYTDSVDAYSQLQAKINETIGEGRKFYSCESAFGKPSFYYQGKQVNKWYLINVAAVTTPLGNMKLVNEITTFTADNLHFQAVYEKVHFTPEVNYLFPSVSRAGTETTTYVFSASLRGAPSIQHSYKKGSLGYYTFLATGKCSVITADQFSEVMTKRTGR